MLKVRLFCGGGMSTSVVARKMVDYANANGIEVEVDAKPVSLIGSSTVEQLSELDCALLGPQVAFEKQHFLPKFAEAGVPAEVIPMRAYGMCDGEAVMKLAFQLMGRDEQGNELVE